MKYGLIAEKLGHSYSKIIHEMLKRYDYDLMPMPENSAAELLKSRKFDGLNVTIPYKSFVMPYLDFISPDAKRIGAVNTIVNRNGKLYGYNTDYTGFRQTLLRAGFEISGKNVLILGTGGTSKTVFTVCSDLCAKKIFVASRTPAADQIDYDTACGIEADYIINTTPCGMYPNTGAAAIDIKKFKNLSGVIDVIFNPLYTKLLLDCREAGIPHANGLYMLVSQAMASAELFTGEKVSRGETERIYKSLCDKTENTVLIGMPYSGKTTVGGIISEMTGKPFIDTDAEISKKTGDIASFIREYGEGRFREIEAQTIKECLKDVRGAVVATGGGAVLRKENVRALRENGVIYYLDRRLSLLQADDTRPLSSSREELAKRYAERKNKYRAACDHRILNNDAPEKAAEKIITLQRKSRI